MSNEQKTSNPFTPENLVKGLSEVNVPLSSYGNVYKDTCSNIENKIVDLLSNAVPELDHVLVYPKMSARGGQVEEIKCYAYFNTSLPGNNNITRKGGGTPTNNGGGVTTIFDFQPPTRGAGGWSTSKLFKETFAPLCDLDKDGNIIIESIKSDKRVAVVELNFWLVGALILNIESDAPYNFTVLAVEQTGNYRDGGTFEDAVILMMKYIDNRRRKGRNRGNGRAIDYRAMDRDIINSNRGNGNGTNGGGRRY